MSLSQPSRTIVVEPVQAAVEGAPLVAPEAPPPPGATEPQPAEPIRQETPATP